MRLKVLVGSGDRIMSVTAPFIAVGVVAWFSSKKPTLRFVNTALTLFLAALAVLLPSLSLAARINTAVVALVLLALSAVSPVHLHRPTEPAGPPGPQPPPAV